MNVPNMFYSLCGEMVNKDQNECVLQHNEFTLVHTESEVLYSYICNLTG